MKGEIKGKASERGRASTSGSSKSREGGGRRKEREVLLSKLKVTFKGSVDRLLPFLLSHHSIFLLFSWKTHLSLSVFEEKVIKSLREKAKTKLIDRRPLRSELPFPPSRSSSLPHHPKFAHSSSSTSFAPSSSHSPPSGGKGTSTPEPSIPVPRESGRRDEEQAASPNPAWSWDESSEEETRVTENPRRSGVAVVDERRRG